MLETLTCDSFAKYLNQGFAVSGEGGGLTLELIEAKEIGSAESQGARQSFSLLFRGPREPLLEQKIYALSHAEMGEIGLFLVPVNQDSKGAYYEVIFT